MEEVRNRLKGINIDTKTFPKVVKKKKEYHVKPYKNQNKSNT